MSTPQQKRSTRANSHSNITLSDIKDLIESSKKELLKAVEQETEKLTNCINQLRLRVESLEKSNEALHQKNGQMEAEIEELKSERCQEINELQERVFRQNNLIISGVAEKTEGSVQDRKAHDVSVCEKLCNELGIMGDFEEITRIGRNDTGPKPRLIRLRCKVMNMKQSILRNSKKLKDLPAYKGIFINPDRTRLQQKNDKALRDELKRRRGHGENVIISNNKIIDIKERLNFQNRF